MFDRSDEEPVGIPEFGPVASLSPNELLRDAEQALVVQARMEWERYAVAAELHRQLVQPHAGTEAEMRATDPFAVCAARIGAAQMSTQYAAEIQINRALALRDRLPLVNLALRDGKVAPHHIPAIITRTELIEGSAHMADIDRDIAEHLRRRGSWSKKRMRDMVDASIFRRDPDLVRNNREDAKNNRGVWGCAAEYGMATIDAHGTAEEMAMIMARLEKLAMAVCKADPRRKADRLADALFATVMGREFRCECPNDPKYPCTADIITIPADQLVSGVDVKVVLHVIADQATVDGAANNPGFIADHGVISGDHVRDIAARPDVLVRPIGNKTKKAKTEGTMSKTESVTAGPLSGCTPQPNRKTRRSKKARRANKAKKLHVQAPPIPDLAEFPVSAKDAKEPFVQTVPLPATQPGDGYRPSAVLDSYLRIRDAYCMWPGCDEKAWDADLDHTREYNHLRPDAGGCTHPSEMKALCRFHHLMKTYTDWLDDQSLERGVGCPRLVFTTPEGRDYVGPAWTGEDLFPALRMIVFDEPRGPSRRPPPATSPPTPQQHRTQPRTAAKHVRRQQERVRNRLRRKEQERSIPPAPF